MVAYRGKPALALHLLVLVVEAVPKRQAATAGLLGVAAKSEQLAL